LPLSIEDVERIEVVRGPNAAAYGANAFFGVINIVTRDPSQVPGAHVAVHAGEQDMRGALLRYGGGNGRDFDYRLSLSDQRRDRFDTQAEKTTTRHLDFRGDYRLSDTGELSVNIAASRGDWRQGHAGDISDPVRDDVEVGSEHVQARYKQVIDAGTEWSLQFYHIRSFVEDAFTVAVPPPPSSLLFDYSQTQWREDVEFQMIHAVADSARLAWGAEARWERVDAPGYFYSRQRRSGALYRAFANIEWAPAEEWVVNGGVMAEHHYCSGLDLSPRVAVNYLPTPNHAFRASIGQAYRSPTFFEKDGDWWVVTATGTQLAPIRTPATALDPETILSRELGYVGHLPSLKLQIDARVFNDRVRKLVGSQLLGVTPLGAEQVKNFQAINEHRADIRGADLQLRWRPVRDADLVLNYAWVKIDSADADIRQSAPENNFSALGVYRLPAGWEISAAVYRVGYMVWLDGGDWTKAYTRVDARLGKRWKWQGHQMELSLVGQNLGTEHYAEFRESYTAEKSNLFDTRAYVGLALDW
jgi:iron complex outermembrane receptor protein